MKFILWTLVWWGIAEIEIWRIYRYRGASWVDENNGFLLLAFALQWFLYIYLYNHYIK